MPKEVKITFLTLYFCILDIKNESSLKLELDFNKFPKNICILSLLPSKYAFNSVKVLTFINVLSLGAEPVLFFNETLSSEVSTSRVSL